MNASAGWKSVFPPDERQVYRLYKRKDRPSPNWRRCALLVVDVTEAFLGPRLPVLQAARQRRTACGSAGWDALPAIQALITNFRRSERPVIYGKPDRADDPIAGEVMPAEDELVVAKSGPSAFFGTSLARYFISEGLDTVIVTGATTSGCVRASAVDAASLGIRTVVAADACFDRSRLSHQVALFELDIKYATVLSSHSITRRLRRA